MPDGFENRVPADVRTPAAQPANSAVTSLSVFETTDLESIIPGRETNTTAYQGTELINFTFGRLTIGGGTTFLRSDSDLLYLENGRSQSIGAGASLNAALDLGNALMVGGAVGFTTTETAIFRTIQGVPSAGEYDSRTFFGSAFLSRFVPIGTMLYLQPTARLQFSNTRSDSYTETLGIEQPGQTNTLGRLSLGGQAGAVLSAGQWLLVPNVEAFFNYDFDRPLFQTDRTGVDLRIGANAIRGDLSVGLSLQTTVERRDIASFEALRSFVSYKFATGGAAAVAPEAQPDAAPDQHVSWSGAYIGPNLGVGSRDPDYGGCADGHGCARDALTVPTFPNGTPADVIPVEGTFFDDRDERFAFVTGGQIGWNRQFGVGSGPVVGVEADLQFTGFRERLNSVGGFGAGGLFEGEAVLPAVSIFPGGQGFGIAPSTRELGIGNNANNVALFENAFAPDARPHAWFGTVRARIGYGFDRLLAYATGGLAFTDTERDENFGGFANGAAVPADFFIGPASQQNAATVVPSCARCESGGTEFGYALGGGVEYAFTDGVSAKIEGLYVDFGEDRDLGARVVGVSNSGAPITATDLGREERDDFLLVRGGLNFRFSTR